MQHLSKIMISLPKIIDFIIILAYNKTYKYLFNNNKEDLAMRKMNENEMMSANGGYTYYCVCGFTVESGNDIFSLFFNAITYNSHLKRCVEAHEAGII